MLFNQTHIIAASLMFLTPMIPHCEWDDHPGGGGKGKKIDKGEGGIDECDPEEPDDPCLSCLRASCCPEMQACEDDPACDCVSRCMSDEGGVANCAADRCGVTDLAAALEPLRWGCPVNDECGGELAWCAAPDLPDLW